MRAYVKLMGETARAYGGGEEVAGCGVGDVGHRKAYGVCRPTKFDCDASRGTKWCSLQTFDDFELVSNSLRYAISNGNGLS